MSSTFDFPSPVGGVALSGDLGISIVFSVLYASLLPVGLIHFVNKRSRTLLSINSVLTTVERYGCSQCGIGSSLSHAIGSWSSPSEHGKVRRLRNRSQKEWRLTCKSPLRWDTSPSPKTPSLSCVVYTSTPPTAPLASLRTVSRLWAPTRHRFHYRRLEEIGLLLMATERSGLTNPARGPNIVA